MSSQSGPGAVTVLMHFANPSAEICSFEGLIGYMFPGDMLVTSPNTNIIFTPPLNTCKVRFQKALNFGKDDPIYYSQSFEPCIGHLALTPYLSQLHKNSFYLAWYELDEHINLSLVSNGSGDLFSGLLILHPKLGATFSELCNGAQ
ncbi:hypothetical protein BT96DRAFT_998955 [Gymnopus androsaceus JB14]|uniref:Uncharacterized protein n=1 Tax=Gymnopus androsaceus JB14 TaxID=1447944 RepID=A0A6A4H9E4_9AGAR|nr:hypothetical protein BT96DRAFT_998955 [Gymnopus androsaceus JB14]